jgi:hypothetical protein
MPVYFAWFTTALLSVGGDANDQNLPQSGRLLYCVGSGFLDIYPTFCRINRGLFELATARKLARQLNKRVYREQSATPEALASGLLGIRAESGGSLHSPVLRR